MRPDNEPVKITSDRFDPDEAAWVKIELSFPASTRVAWHSNRVDFAALQTAETEELVTQLSDHIVVVLLELLDRWTFRVQRNADGTRNRYESGVDRPLRTLNAEELRACNTADLMFLFGEAMAVYATHIQSSADIITPAAAKEGLTAANFRPTNSTPMVVSG